MVSRKRRPGQVILHHRTVHPVVIREWSIPMERFGGAIWQSRRTTDRFKAATQAVTGHEPFVAIRRGA
ncbi:MULTISPECIES: hypothetical protein [unclassified Nonomuraea]|uniref:hypothetical protein n=1 Tax=unclassified Nonomuraea TaxID=2593643 RepID=UPI0033C750FB